MLSQYQYIARNSAGQQVMGTLQAISRDEVLRTLAIQSLFPVKLNVTQKSSPQGKRIPAAALAAMYEQLADLLGSGIPLLKALEILSDQSNHPTIKSVLAELRHDVADGHSLSEGMRRRSHVFSDLAISLVEAGEEGGFLDDSLQRIVQFSERQEELRGRVQGALAYPAFLVLVGSLVVIGMMIFFVPQFAPLFDRMRSRGMLPWPTVMLLGVSDTLRHYGWMLLASMAVVGVVMAKGMRDSRWPHFRDQALLGLWLFGPITRSLCLARFCRVLGTLLKNAVPLLKALRIAKNAAGNRVLQEAIQHAAEHVSEGKSLSSPLARSGVFPTDVLEMITVGETSNRLETVLGELADKLERRTQRRIDACVKLLEPCLMLMMALVIGFLVVALLMPVFEGSENLA